MISDIKEIQDSHQVDGDGQASQEQLGTIGHKRMKNIFR